MALKVPLAGQLQLLDKMLKDTLDSGSPDGNENVILKLYRVDYTPDSTTVQSSMTEANFTGYAAKTLTRTGWNSAVTVNSKAESSYGSVAQNWTCGSTGNTVYGYWIQAATSNTCLWAEKFSVARVLAEGDVLNLTPKFSLDSES
jgi:hypothetical protein